MCIDTRRPIKLILQRIVLRTLPLGKYIRVHVWDANAQCVFQGVAILKYSADALAFLSAMIESTLVVYIGVFARVSDLVRSGYCDNFLYKDNIWGASTHVSLISLVCVCACACVRVHD